jgi:hypothetical protein
MWEENLVLSLVLSNDQAWTTYGSPPQWLVRYGETTIFFGLRTCHLFFSFHYTLQVKVAEYHYNSCDCNVTVRWLQVHNDIMAKLLHFKVLPLENPFIFVFESEAISASLMSCIWCVELRILLLLTSGRMAMALNCDHSCDCMLRVGEHHQSIQSPKWVRAYRMKTPRLWSRVINLFKFYYLSIRTRHIRFYDKGSNLRWSTNHYSTTPGYTYLLCLLIGKSEPLECDL